MEGTILLFILTVKIIAGLAFLAVYFRGHRKSALYLSLGWLVSSTLPASIPMGVGINVNPILMGIATALTLLGMFHLVVEETEASIPKMVYYSLPSLPLAYGLIESIAKASPGGTYVVSGTLLVISGAVLIEILSSYYKSKAQLFGIAIFIAGVMSMLYPLVHFNGTINEEQAVYISSGIAAFMAYAYYELIYSERFLDPERFKNGGSARLSLSRGIIVTTPEGFGGISESLTDYPVLAFLRTMEPVDGWICYRISTVEGSKTISPTSLYRITQISSQYFREARKMGKHGVVVLETPEFLKLYNDFKSVLKLLSTLKDLAYLSNGSLVVITTKEVWEREEWNYLLRILE